MQDLANWVVAGLGVIWTGLIGLIGLVRAGDLRRVTALEQIVLTIGHDQRGLSQAINERAVETARLRAQYESLETSQSSIHEKLDRLLDRLLDRGDAGRRFVRGMSDTDAI